MDDFLKKLDLVSMVDTSKLKEKALEFTKIKSENPNFNQSQICKMLGTSDSTMRRIRNDLGMGSPFRHAVKIKRKKNLNEVKLSVSGTTSEIGKSFYCTQCLKAFKSTKSCQAHNCLKKNTRIKDALASGIDSGTTSGIFSTWKEEEAVGEEELDEVLNRKFSFK